MLQSSFKLAAAFFLATSFAAYSGVVVDSTRYLYKEGAREISAHVENKDNIPYLIKSWVEVPDGQKDSHFLVTPPLFRLEGKQKNTLRILANANIANAPQDRDTLYFFSVMYIPPSSDLDEDKNKVQLAVRHRMRLIYRPKTIQDLSINTEAEKLEWRRVNNKIVLKNPTPFFIYFKSVKIGNKDVIGETPHISAYTTKEFSLPIGVNGTEITWKVATESGGTGSTYTSSL
uniref:fimbrial biogenesis chaperone n=1 Tax=Klebsiella sp. TaxID=576 RepID=UPI002587AA39|nr:molecular chaperone [Klebsiella sp.]